MLYTLADARTQLGRFVEDGGSCNTVVIDQRLNEAIARLTDADDLECMIKNIRIQACNFAFPLPYNVEKIINATVNGTPAQVFGTAYQFLSSGPGDLDYGGSCSGFQDLVDLGDDFAIMYGIPPCYDVDGTEYEPGGMQLAAFSESADDVDKILSLFGFDINAREMSVELPISRWKGGDIGRISGRMSSPGKTWDHTEEKFEDVTRVTKPVTTGTVYLYAVDPVNDYFFFLAAYHPSQTIPQFRRYGITNKTVGYRSCVLARVKLRHIPLSVPTDLLPVDSLDAVKLMLIAIRHENAGDLAQAANYMNQAERVMQNRERSRTLSSGTPVILDRQYRTSLGRFVNRRGRIL